MRQHEGGGGGARDLSPPVSKSFAEFNLQPAFYFTPRIVIRGLHNQKGLQQVKK